jgi:hypothetical protein
MKQITCPHCGDTYPDFDVAHVCSSGPYAPRLKPQMNKRIKELIDKATTIEEHGWGASYENFDKEKFAELIVQKCANLADEAEPYKAADLIKKHFGVTE